MIGVKNQLLDICTEMLEEISNTESDPHFGTPPSVFYIDFAYGNKRTVGFYISDPLETYKYENGVLEIVKVGTKNRISPVSGMYFPEGRGAVGIDSNYEYAFVSFQVGPRYGRGFRYRIIDEGESKRLGEQELIWVS
ncbi:hypothetical protein [Hornefia butyriciproducens]|uniref:hypothetical protein n=1 Tax=Hornefia butyriciproducens TaxID=2652293 RepID=UPI0023F55610|nr:hypothetical protein [Hornefia butyriciproducens]MDD6299088.1 hypothetical protein [Hornefia butyriciproducens]